MRGQQLEGELCGLQAAQKVTVVELAQCREAAGLLRQECDGLKAELGRERKETERLSRQNTGLERKLEVDEVSLLRRRLAETEARLEDCRDELQRQRPLASKASQYEAAMHAEVWATPSHAPMALPLTSAPLVLTSKILNSACVCMCTRFRRTSS